jgi:hypothetical protein
MGDQVDVVLVGADRPDGGAQRGRSLKIDGDGPQHRIVGTSEARADTFIALLRQRELRVGEFQGFADHLQDLDDLGPAGLKLWFDVIHCFSCIFRLAFRSAFAPNGSAFWGTCPGMPGRTGFSDSIFWFSAGFLSETALPAGTGWRQGHGSRERSTRRRAH